MSILNVEHLSHGFGDRAIFEDVSFRLLKGEHIGLVGANGEGKSTFMNIITGRLMPDEGKIEWAKKVRVGYLDQHTALEKGMTIGSVLSSAFDFLYDMENEMNDIYARLGDVDEMDEIGYEDYFYGEGICLIEWSERIREILPEHPIQITIEKDLEKGFDYRKISVNEQ